MRLTPYSLVFDTIAKSRAREIFAHHPALARIERRHASEAAYEGRRSRSTTRASSRRRSAISLRRSKNRIDEAAEIKDKAAALRAFARQRDDAELEVWTSEIKLRASIRIGELVPELETAPAGGAGGGADVSAVRQPKQDAIADAGLSRATAYRYEDAGLGGAGHTIVRRDILK